MPTLYAWSTPNGYKPLILLEELGLHYDLVRVDLTAQEQKTEAFLAINPNGKIPVLYDDLADLTITESGAMMLYLAEQHGRFVPSDARGRAATLSWLFFQMASVGPMMGQAAHFKSRQETSPYAWERYHDESRRILGVLDQRLADVPFLAGEAYSIADMATWPWNPDCASLRTGPGRGSASAALEGPHRGPPGRAARDCHTVQRARVAGRPKTRRWLRREPERQPPTMLLAASMAASNTQCGARPMPTVPSRAMAMAAAVGTPMAGSGPWAPWSGGSM